MKQAVGIWILYNFWAVEIGIRIKLPKSHQSNFWSCFDVHIYIFPKIFRKQCLTSQIFRGADWCLTQFSGGAELSLKPVGLYFQYMLLLVHFPCSEFSRLIITAACSYFPSVCLPLSSWKDQDGAGTLLGWLCTKKHVSDTRSKSHYWDNYEMIMKHFGDVVVERTRSFGWSHLQKGDWSQLPWSSGLDILARRFSSKRQVTEIFFSS